MGNVDPFLRRGRVTARADAGVDGHTRMTGYVRGRTGVVTALRPGQVLPDSAAHFRGEAPEHVYSVEFDARELWGPDGEQFSVTIDLFESYLDPAPEAAP